MCAERTIEVSPQLIEQPELVKFLLKEVNYNNINLKCLLIESAKAGKKETFEIVLKINYNMPKHHVSFIFEAICDSAGDHTSLEILDMFSKVCDLRQMSADCILSDFRKACKKPTVTTKFLETIMNINPDVFNSEKNIKSIIEKSYKYSPTVLEFIINKFKDNENYGIDKWGDDIMLVKIARIMSEELYGVILDIAKKEPRFNVNVYDSAPLQIQCFKGHLSNVEKLLSFNNINVTAQNNLPLRAAYDGGRYNIMARLLQLPAVRNSLSPEDTKFYETVLSLVTLH